MTLLSGKKGLVMGVVNDRSIASSIAKAATTYGADLAFSYQSEKLKDRVASVANTIGINNPLLIECDVRDVNSVMKMKDIISDQLGNIDFVVHCLAFSDKNELRGRYTDTSHANFLDTMDVSCFSLPAVLRVLEEILNNNASVITLSYYGAEKVVPSYNVMGVAKAALEASVRYLANDFGEKGIRVNAISAGPIKTLAASAISGFSDFLNVHSKVSPLKRNTTLEDVAGAATFLLSDLSSGVTGHVLYVDCGYNIIGMTSSE